jgi:membrane AbrB-like protein
VAVAAAGGAGFSLVGLPAGWLTGAMVVVAITAMAGMPVAYPDGLRNVIFVVLGSSLGAGVTPEMVSDIGRWPISMAILIGSVAAVQISGQLFLRRVCGWDRQTSFFAAVPGVTSYVIALALPSGANISRIALSQTLRVFLLVGLAPSLLTAVENVGTVVRVTGSPLDIALSIAIGAGGGLLLGTVGVPAAPMIGALAASGIAHGAGLLSGAFPIFVQAGLFIALGAMIGSRFAGTTVAMLRGTVLASIGSFAAAVTAAAACAWFAATVTGQSFSQIALAFAPGGMDVMTAMAFALGLDSAFVAAHQLARFFIIALYAPFFAQRIGSAHGLATASPPDTGLGGSEND